ncbi:MAG: hypothetical protein A3B23_01415 [Candidatus Colwellbacteria bacterium RIFCSPLOWO2_01_FULL_48_10]|uniref:Uncharacterized protein n=1 Tax=Candidatus Colwellbacteria bacterium RIFCSPLOWO2_01_FULL_48_10 TaxID=1797690 RepID=A0A1G1Z6U3_9BACT|nr:MAG: hypothetical protein A3B23_01415 [Candidatus Colwellbacteria bacterium RIFCSPLOWO2_01_FULL_48_10]
MALGPHYGTFPAEVRKEDTWVLAVQRHSAGRYKAPEKSNLTRISTRKALNYIVAKRILCAMIRT